MTSGSELKILEIDSCFFSLPASNPALTERLDPWSMHASITITITTKIVTMIETRLAKRSSESFRGRDTIVTPTEKSTAQNIWPTLVSAHQEGRSAPRRPRVNGVNDLKRTIYETTKPKFVGIMQMLVNFYHLGP